MASVSPRLGLTRRGPAGRLPPLRVTARDIGIIRAVWACRALTTPQIHALFFSEGRADGARRGSTTTGISTRCQRRLQLLYHHGYLQRHEQPQRLSEGRKPLVYFLDQGGVQLLSRLHRADGTEIDWRRKDNRISAIFLEHLLATNDVRVSIALAARRDGLAVERWLDERALKADAMKDYMEATWSDKDGRRHHKRLAVVPDGYFVLSHGARRGHFFLEIDLATEPGKRWADKVRAYRTYLESGAYQKRYRTRSLRVLTVTTGAKRLANLIATTEAVGGGALFWFTTLAEAAGGGILADPIWHKGNHEGLHSLIGHATEGP